MEVIDSIGVTSVGHTQQIAAAVSSFMKTEEARMRVEAESKQKERIELLEARLARLNVALAETEKELRLALERANQEPGISSIYKSLEGIRDTAKDFQRKWRCSRISTRRTSSSRKLGTAVKLGMGVKLGIAAAPRRRSTRLRPPPDPRDTHPAAPRGRRPRRSLNGFRPGRHGSASMNPQILLTHGDFVRALARSLVDADGAEDVAQDTWVAAWLHAPRAAGLRSWLGKVAFNFARQRARGERGARRASEVRGGPSESHRRRRWWRARSCAGAWSGLCSSSRSRTDRWYWRGFFDDLEPVRIAELTGRPSTPCGRALRRGLEVATGAARPRARRRPGVVDRCGGGIGARENGGSRERDRREFAFGESHQNGGRGRGTGFVGVDRFPTFRATQESKERGGGGATGPAVATAQPATAKPKETDEAPATRAEARAPEANVAARVALLSGRVVDPAGIAVPGASVVVFPSDIVAPVSRADANKDESRVRATACDSLGNFETRLDGALADSPIFAIVAEAPGFSAGTL